MASSSFIDVLFILLCAVIVMLIDTAHLGSLVADPADVSPKHAAAAGLSEEQLVAVDAQSFQVEDQTFGDLGALLLALDADRPVLLVSASDEVTHHRVVWVWDQLVASGFETRLGVEREETTP